MSTHVAGLSFERVQIDGFRGLRGLDLDGLGRVNILIGANDSGKTSVLEALSILCKPYDPNEWLAIVRRRDYGGLDETVIHSLRWCFAQSSGVSDPEELFSGGCQFSCEGQFPLRKLAVAYSENFEERARRRPGLPKKEAPQTMRDADLEHEVIWEENQEIGSLRWKRPTDDQPIKLHIPEEGPRISRVNRNLPSLATLPCETLTPYSYQINGVQVTSLSKQIIRDESDQGLSMLQGFDPDVMAVEVLSLRGDRPAIYVKHRRLGWAPLSVFGDAMRRCVLLAATLPQLKDGGVLLIDEVETGIHVKALGRVFQWLIESARQLNVQVFVTTHSLEALDAIILAPAAQEGDVVAFRLSHADGSSKVKRFAGDLLLGLRQERGLDLR